jgi:hypothetical protein
LAAFFAWFAWRCDNELANPPPMERRGPLALAIDASEQVFELRGSLLLNG